MISSEKKVPDLSIFETEEERARQLSARFNTTQFKIFLYLIKLGKAKNMSNLVYLAVMDYTARICESLQLSYWDLEKIAKQHFSAIEIIEEIFIEHGITLKELRQIAKQYKNKKILPKKANSKEYN